MKQTIRMVVIGGGSIGMLWASKWCNSLQVNLITRSKTQSESINKQGIKVTDNTGVTTLQPIQAYRYDDMIDVLNQPFPGKTWLVLAVKQKDVEPIMMKMAESITPHTQLLAIQNGIGHETIIERYVDKKQITYGVTTMGARRLSDFEVMETGVGETYLGPPSSSLDQLLRCKSNRSFHLQMTPDIRMRQWEKLVINALINPLSAIIEVKNGHVGNLVQEHISFVKKIVEEAVKVARAEGIQLNTEEIIQRILLVTERTSENRSSMLEDLLHRRITEIDYINGYIVRTGEEAGIETPLHDMLTFFIHSKTKSFRKEEVR